MTGFYLAALLWFLPGLGLALRLPALGRRDPLLVAAAALLLSAALSTLAALLALWLGLSAAALSWMLIGLAALGGASTLVRRSEGPPAADAPGRVEIAVGAASLFLLALLGARTGATFRVTADTLDHVATLREILASGNLFPRETLHAAEGLGGADPRKGLLHAVYAALAYRSGLDPADFWANLPILATPCVFLAAYGFLRGIGLSARWALVGGWLLVLTRSGGPGGDLAAISGYPNQLGAVLFWLAAGALIRAVDTGDRSTTLAAALGLWAAIAAHVMFALFAALLGAVLLAALLLGPERTRRARRLLAVAGLTAIPALPFLIGRLAASTPMNPIHTEIQGMLFVSRRLYVADPGRLWADVGWFGLLGYPAALWFAGRRARAHLGAAFVMLAPLAMVFLAQNPLLVPLLRERVGYLLFRTFWFLPPALAVAAVLPLLAAGRRPARIAILTLLVLLAALPASRTAATWLTPSPRRDGSLDALRFREPLEEVTRGLPPRSVIATDPPTAALLTAFTSHKGICAYDQHSSPNDARAEARLRAARDILLPEILPGRANQLCAEWGASHVLVSSIWPPGFRTRTWTFQPAAARVRVDSLAASGAFRVARDAPGFVLLEVLPASISLVESPDAPGGAVAARVEVRDSVPAGGRLEVRVEWLPALLPAGEGPLTAILRLDALDAPGKGPLGKPRRKLAQALGGAVWRQRYDWNPGSGFSAPEHWSPEGAWDRVTVPLSPRLVPGRYVVRLAVNRVPFVANHTLRDYLSDRDVYAGAVVDTLTVLAARQGYEP